MHPVEGLAALDLLKALAGNPDLIQRPEGGRAFELVSDFQPAGDQPQAITELVEGLRRQEKDQVLLGVTGSGKTFTMAHVIAQMQRPAIVLAPNKILAAQLYGEFKSFFPNNAVEYFVSYYDYYQPEAYVPRTDTYIEKTSSINEQIDRMRHSATRALFERDDVVIVASVSCIYGIGSPETYARMTLTLKQGQKVERQRLLRALVELQYRRNELDFSRGAFRAKGDTIEIFPAHSGGPRLAPVHVRRRCREHHRVRPAHRRAHRQARPDPALPQQPLRHAEADAAGGGEEHQGGAGGAAGLLPRHRQAARGRAHRAAHRGRHGDDPDHGLMPRHRELFALSDRPGTRRAAADPVRVHPRERDPVRRREPRRGAAGRRHVQGRLPAQEYAWPSSASACRRASTIARSSSTSGT